MTDWRAVYRLQLTPDFGFREARELVPYLQQLGVSHLYLSPSLEARPGSTHGYDVTDPTRVREELGGEAAFRELARAGLGILLDVVPNHMAASEEENPFWRDPALRLKFFDVDPETGWHRRFFTISDLAGVRVEEPEVFETTHRKVLELVREGLVDGLRIDHIDGLARPAEYLSRLRERGVEHVWVEKILEPGEELPSWPVEGTTGYEFANDVTALFVNRDAEQPFTELYAELTGERRSFHEVAQEAKLEQVRSDFRAEVERLARLSGLPRQEIERDLAALSVYRSYREPADEFTTLFQQVSGAIMAKGVEDTAFYRYNRLVALNEVGGDAGRFGLPLEKFHRGNEKRAARFPRNLLTTLSHDTKRSGDVRARIVALTWMVQEWEAFARRFVGRLDDPNESYLLLQTLVGAWPIEPERLEAYVEKALREAKVSTSWSEPNLGHEGRVKEASRVLLAEPEVARFAARVGELGRRISLGMTLLKLTSPGVPDVYQGDELETFHLVDPDNRRPVDWEARRRSLADPPSKLRVTLAGLAVHGRLGGEYEVVDVGGGVCAYRRGDVLVAVPLTPDAAKPDQPGDVLGDLPVGLYVH